MLCKEKKYWIRWLVSLQVCLIFGLSLASEQDLNQKTFSVLTQNFDTQEEKVQSNILRQIGLLQLTQASAFLTEVALSDSHFTPSIRKQALKAMLALDSEAYRPVLLVLSSSVLDQEKLYEAMMLLPLDRTIKGWIRSVDFDSSTLNLERKFTPILQWIEQDRGLSAKDFSTWDQDQASIYINQKIKAEPKVKAWRVLKEYLDQ